MRSSFLLRSFRSTILVSIAALAIGACADVAPTQAPSAGSLAVRRAASAATPLAHWAPATNAPGAGDLAVTPDGRMFAAGETYGLLVSEGSMLRWRRVASFPADAAPMSVAAAPDGALYVGTDRGVLRSPDGGTTWLGGGLTGGYVRQVATDTRGNVYAGVQGVGGGVLRSDDGGIHWTMVEGPFGGRGGIIDWISVRKDDVLLGLYSQTPKYSHDKGATWDYLGSLWELPEWNAFANHMLETSRGSLLATWAGGIARSVDGGQEFKHVFAGANVHKLAQDATSGALYAMQDDGSVLRSTDDGVTWAVYTAAFRPRGVVSFAVVPGGGLVLGTWEGIWRTVP